MANYAICNETFNGWEWKETCVAAAEAGYTGIEIAPFTLAEDIRTIGARERDQLAASAQREGMTIIGLHWLLVSPTGLSLTCDDDRIRGRTSEYLAALVDFCADLGGSRMVLGSPSQRRLPLNSDRQLGEARTLAEDRFERCLLPALARAEAHKVTICIEPLPGPEADFILTLADAVRIADRIGHANVKTIFDVKSANSEVSSPWDLIHQFAPSIAHVHANDANRRGPGFGDTDFRPIMSALSDIGYSGYISVEVFDYTPDPVTIAVESLKYMRACENENDVR